MNYKTYFTPANGYNPRFGQRKATGKTPLFYSAWDADLVWAAAAYAYRVNGNNFFKEQNQSLDTVTQTVKVLNQPNKIVAMTELREHLAANITEEDVVLGSQARRFHKLTLTALALKGPLSDFQNTVMQSSNKNVFFLEVDRLEFAVVASQITAFLKSQKELVARENTQRRPLSADGTKVAVNVTVVRSVYSQKYGCFFVTARTDCHHMVFFSYRESLVEGLRLHVKATVKAFRNDTTQLSRAKIGSLT